MPTSNTGTSTSTSTNPNNNDNNDNNNNNNNNNNINSNSSNGISLPESVDIRFLTRPVDWKRWIKVRSLSASSLKRILRLARVPGSISAASMS